VYAENNYLYAMIQEWITYLIVTLAVIYIAHGFYVRLSKKTPCDSCALMKASKEK
jgi:hypothetical protein